MRSRSTPDQLTIDGKTQVPWKPGQDVDILGQRKGRPSEVKVVHADQHAAPRQ